LRRGDIVIAAGGRAIHAPGDFAHASAAAGAPIGLTIRRGTATRTITLAPAARAVIRDKQH
jgi:S1-C subfamily serine protease